MSAGRGEEFHELLRRSSLGDPDPVDLAPLANENLRRLRLPIGNGDPPPAARTGHSLLDFSAADVMAVSTVSWRDIALDMVQDAWRNRRAVTLWVTALVTAVAIFIYCRLTDHPGLDVYSNILQIVGPGTAGVVCLRVAARAVHDPGQSDRRWARWYWTLLGLSPLSWAAGQVAWTAQENILGANVRSLFVSWPDYGYLGAVFSMTAALLMLRSSNWRVSPLATLCNGLMIGLSLFLVAWVTSLSSLMNDVQRLKEQIVSPIYPVGDVVNCSIVLTILIGCNRTVVKKLYIVSSGQLLILVADLIYLYLQPSQKYETGSWIDLGWIVGFSLIGMSAVTEGHMIRPRRRASEASLTRTLLPYVALLVPTATLTLVALTGRKVGAVAIGVSIAIVVTVIGRQILASIELRSLYRLREQDRTLRDEVQAAMSTYPTLTLIQKLGDARSGLAALRRHVQQGAEEAVVAQLIDALEHDLIGTAESAETISRQSQGVSDLLAEISADLDASPRPAISH